MFTRWIVTNVVDDSGRKVKSTRLYVYDYKVKIKRKGLLITYNLNKSTNKR